MSNPCCIKSVDDLGAFDFQYYDKDGFELNRAEQKFYAQMGYPINFPILNHTCWQEPWFELETDQLGLILDHSIFLCRANYSGAALEQIQQLKQKIPFADYLIRSKNKWGFDFALDAVSDNGTTFEVIHTEYDNYNYDRFKNRMINFEYIVRHTDWVDAAKRIWHARDLWQCLHGFEQNHWKAEYLLGWKKSEYTEKAV